MSVPAPDDLDTGVSNGDVDWLFRGKSKKLTKRMHGERRPLATPADTELAKDKTPKELGPPDGSAGEASNEAGDHPKSGKGGKCADTAENISHSKDAKSAVGPAVAPDSRPITSGLPLPAEDPKGRLSRSRSGLVSSSDVRDSQQLPQTAAPQPKRKFSAGFMGSTLAPPNDDNNPSPGVSRTNSGKSKLLLLLISSKFRLVSFSGGSGSEPHTPNPGSPSLGPTSSHSPRQPSQGLAALVNRPPPEAGIQIPGRNSRRLSLTSSIGLSPRLLAEKERGLFFKRRLLTADPNAAGPDATGGASGGKHKNARFVLNKNTTRPNPPLADIPEPKLRRVVFALDLLPDDPQQQIPSRRPKKGNVVLPEDLTAPVPRLSQGISVDGAKVTANEPRYSERDLAAAVEAHKRALLTAEKHAMEAHLLAKKLAAHIAQMKLGTMIAEQTVPEEAEDVADDVARIEIDKPLHMHENHFQSTENDNEDSGHDDTNHEVSLESVYTRCCHLREILPIPATLKQLKNKSRPLPVLKLLNPKPTLIDVLSFSDFIAITDINTVIFDNVTLTTEMLKCVLSSLLHNRSINKLSLRNLAIDEQGWYMLCEFLSMNTTVNRLDISQQRVKTVTKATSFRLAMNWDLFIRSIVARGGIEELVMGGCKLTDDTFRLLLQSAISISTCRLGLAATEINISKCEMLARWITAPNSKCLGLDIAYNDLSNGQLRPFIDALSRGQTNLWFFSLNSTNITDVDEAAELLRALANVKSLRFLDLSSLPQLFPALISKLSKILPLFPSLKRIHFDLNELSPQSIGAISDILPRINGLVHVSLLGNRLLNRESAGALYAAVKKSALFTVDMDYDLVPDELSQRLALYLMRNLDRTIRPDITHISGENDQDDVMFDGSLLMESAEKLLVESDKNCTGADAKLQRIITNALIERTRAVRKDIQKIINRLFEKRINGDLSFEGKETLLRFCLLDASLEKVVYMIEQKAQMFDGTTLSPLPSVSGPNTSFKIDDAALSPENYQVSSSELIDAGPILMAKDLCLVSTNAFQGMEQTFQPHMVVVDSNSDGQNVPIDDSTGRPVLLKSMSQTSLHAKEQEEEEGEFLRWGYFVEHHPDTPHEENKLPVFGVPSGSELRETVIDAKGIDSVKQLISKINTQRLTIDKVFSGEGPDSSRRVSDDNEHDFKSEDEVISMDSSKDQKLLPVVDEAYDKLLNEAQKVHSNKDPHTTHTQA